MRGTVAVKYAMLPQQFATLVKASVGAAHVIVQASMLAGVNMTSICGIMHLKTKFAVFKLFFQIMMFLSGQNAGCSAYCGNKFIM